MNTVLQENSTLPRYPKKAFFPLMAALTNEIMGKRHEGRPGYDAYKRYLRAAELWEQAKHPKRAAKLYEKAGDLVDDRLLFSHGARLLEKIDSPQALRLYEKAILSTAKQGDAMLATADEYGSIKLLAGDAAVFYGHASEFYAEASRLCLRAAAFLNPCTRKTAELKKSSEEFLGKAFYMDLKKKKAEIESAVPRL